MREATNEEIKERLKGLMSEKRYQHSILVAEAAERLAKMHAVAPERAYKAGLAHDMAKELSDKQNRYFVALGGLDEELLKPENAKIIHADVGAVAAKEWFGLADDLCQAIKYHTVARPGMTTLDKVVFIADKIGRTDMPEELSELPEMAERDLDEAMVYFLERQAKVLAEKGVTQSPETQEFLRETKECISL